MMAEKYGTSSNNNSKYFEAIYKNKDSTDRSRLEFYEAGSSPTNFG